MAVTGAGTVTGAGAGTGTGAGTGAGAGVGRDDAPRTAAEAAAWCARLDPDAAARLGAHLVSLAGGLQVAVAFDAVPSGWSGQASTLYAGRAEQQQRAVAAAATALGGAGRGVLAHAAVLAAVLGPARRAATALADADAARGSWLRACEQHEHRRAVLVRACDAAGSTGDPVAQVAARTALARHDAGAPSPADPSLAARQGARTTLAGLAQQVDDSGAATARHLVGAAARAPQTPSLPERLAVRAREFAASVRTGASEEALAAVGTLPQLLRFSPGRVLVDPAGYATDVVAEARGVEGSLRTDAAELADHPVRFAVARAEGALDWQTLRVDRGRWVGHVLGTAVVAGTTDGAGEALAGTEASGAGAGAAAQREAERRARHRAEPAPRPVPRPGPRPPGPGRHRSATSTGAALVAGATGLARSWAHGQAEELKDLRTAPARAVGAGEQAQALAPGAPDADELTRLRAAVRDSAVPGARVEVGPGGRTVLHLPPGLDPAAAQGRLAGALAASGDVPEHLTAAPPAAGSTAAGSLAEVWRDPVDGRSITVDVLEDPPPAGASGGRLH